MSNKPRHGTGSRRKQLGNEPPKGKGTAERRALPSNEEILTVREAKHTARLQRQADAAAAAERRRRASSLRRAGVFALVALLAATGGLALYLNEAGKPGQGVAQQPSPHIANVSEPHSYSTDPPTSGPHLREIAPWGVSTTAVVKESQVHNLEDGGVVINYRPDLDKPSVDRLAELARRYDSDILMAPYPGLSDTIVLTTWGRIDRLGALDEARIRRFIEAFRGKDHHKDSGS